MISSAPSDSGYVKTFIKKSSGKLLILLVLTGILFFCSCESKIEKIQKSEILNLPSVTARNASTLFTDSGKVQLKMSFPIMETYSNADPSYSEFRSGISVEFYDGQEKPVGTVTAKYARYTDEKKLWELKDSVVVINENRDMLETEQLFWDQEKDLIYTERLVKITNEDQTVIGTGFESDSKLNKRKIKNVSATIYLREE
jgi:LPS export ABC transporter protein LptC